MAGASIIMEVREVVAWMRLIAGHLIAIEWRGPVYPWMLRGVTQTAHMWGSCVKLMDWGLVWRCSNIGQDILAN
jgi:hypothetical protein